MSEPSALQQQIAEAIHRNRFPDSTWDRQPAAIQADYLDCAAAVLAVVLPHGKFLGDQLRHAENRLAVTRATLDAVLRQFVHKGHPGEPCLQTGWISEKTVARWRAVLYPPAPDPAVAPTVRECAGNDQRWPLEKEGL